MPNEQPKRKKKHRKWPWVILVLVVAIIAYFVYAAQSAGQTMYSEEVAQLRDISTYYSFSGNLTPITDEVQTAKESLKVKEIYVKEGDRVTAGAPLLRATDGTRVYAAHTGTLETLSVEADDTLQPGSQIARIVDYDALEVSIDVDEYDIDAVALGKEGTVYLNALDRSVTGTVTEIARNATTDGGVSYYAVKMQVEAPQDVRSGMSVEVSILNRQSLSTVSLSMNAISYDEYNKPYVLKRDAEGHAVAQTIETGVSDGRFIEVTSGVAEGETVLYLSQDMMRFFRQMQSAQGR